ncbi:hypothetical protein D9M71_115730 [compost metagenome]
MDAVVYEASHEIYFSTKNEVPIADVVTSLLAFERIIKQSPQVLSALTGAEIEHIEVFVEELHSGSLDTKYLLKLFFKDEEELEKFLASIRDKLKEHPMVRTTLLTAVIAGMVGYGLYAAAKIVNSPEAAATIQANNNVIINIGAGEVDMTPEQFTAVVHAAIRDKKALAKDSVRFMAPARTDPDSQVEFDGNPNIVIPKETVRVAPSSIDVERDKHEEALPDVDLHIRATNLDSTTSGWAGLIPGIIDRRLPLELAEGVDPKDVASKFKVRADVTVIYEPKGKAKKLTPVRIILTGLVDPKG